jgi:hypothetical protein
VALDFSAEVRSRRRKPEGTDRDAEVSHD